MVLARKLAIPHQSALTVLGALPILLLTTACESTDSKKDGGGVQGNILVKNENNYRATSKLTIPHVQTTAGADLKICWGAMQKDFLCHAITPAADIDSVSFLQVQNLTQQQVEDDLGVGQSFASNVVPRTYRPQKSASATCTTLSTFALDPTVSPPDTPVVPARDYLANANKIYMLLFANGTRLGLGSRSMLFLEPVADSTVTTVDAVSDSCSILDFRADITSPTPIAVPAAGPFVIDWSAITHDGLGNEVFYSDIDSLQLGFYANATVAELQAKFLDLDRIASSLYELALSGQKHADLAAATSTKDGGFAGFTRTDGVWVLALRCGTCPVPAPIVVAILSPS